MSLSQLKVLNIGIRLTDNIGDVAISEMISAQFSNVGIATEHMDFNFSAVVAHFFNFSFDECYKRKAASSVDWVSIVLGNRFLRIAIKLSRFIVYLPVVLLVFLRKAKGCDKVYIGGGNILMGIEYGFPLQVLSYVIFSRLMGKSAVFLCVGAGPFTAPGVKIILRLALSLTDQVICRDSKSKDLIERYLGASLVDIEVLPDPVLIWPKNQQRLKLKYDVLFTFMPLFSPAIFPDGENSKAEKFKSCMVELVADLIRQGKKVGVMVTDLSVDQTFSEEIVVEVCARTGTKLQVETPANPNEMAALVSSASLVISTRMHGAIMALSQSVPALCICWQPKINGLYKDLGLDELLVLLDNSGGFSHPKVQKTISNLVENKASVVEQISAQKIELEEIYECLWRKLTKTDIA